MGSIRIRTLSGTKVSPRPLGASLRDNVHNRLYEGKQKMASAGAPSTCAQHWNSVNWTEVARLFVACECVSQNPFDNCCDGASESLTASSQSIVLSQITNA